MKQEQEKKISEVTRRDIVDGLLLSGEPFYGRLDLVSFLKRIWALKSMSSTDYRYQDAEGDIWQHMVRNSDWSDTELLYSRLGITDIPDEQFTQFLETCVHPLASRDTEKTANVVTQFNDALRRDGFTMRAAGQLSGRTVYKVVSTTGDGVSQAYEVVLSFAGEDRQYVERVADLLRVNDVPVFYDDYEEATLWGKNLTEHLHKVYSGSARYCVMFISKHYAEKVWPTHERRSAFEKAIESKEEYILPARFDDTQIPGLHKHIVYIDLRKRTPEELTKLVMQKLGREMEVPF